MLKKRYILRTILIVLGVILALTGAFVGEQYYRWHICNFVSRDGEPHEYNIYAGSTTDSVLNLLRDMWHYSGFIVSKDAEGKGKVTVYENGAAGYQPLLADILKFIKSGEPSFPPEESVEIFKLMEAAEMSAKRGGEPVTIEDAEAYATGNWFTRLFL